MFSANVGYHKSCYQTFQARSWKKVHSDKPFTFEKDCIEELVGVIEYLVVLKREVYTLCQLRELYASIKKVDINTIRSIDIKRIVEERLSNKVQFCRPICETRSRGIQSEYVLSADENILLDAIIAILTGEGIINYIQLKAVAYLISSDIESCEKIPWPPTPQNNLETDELLELDKRLFNLIAWIVSPSASISKNGFVRLSEKKTIKASKNVQNLHSLVPRSQPGFNHILLSITTLAKKESQMINNDLKQLGAGISNTETCSYKINGQNGLRT